MNLYCPYCKSKTQFTLQNKTKSHIDNSEHVTYRCTQCNGLIIQIFKKGISQYYPPVGNLQPRVDLSLIVNDAVKEDFKEAIDCYNNGFYNACMIMSRRAIQQEMQIKKAEGDNLYKQIESLEISKNLKTLLHKVKNFGNYGAHPDFCLYDETGNKITDTKEFAQLSLEFLDRYFADEYEIDSLIAKAPKSEKELRQQKNNAN